jgi:hypothetical protein
MDRDVLLVSLFINLICACASRVIAEYTGRSQVFWLCVPVLFGPLALAVLLLLPPRRRGKLDLG